MATVAVGVSDRAGRAPGPRKPAHPSRAWVAGQLSRQGRIRVIMRVTADCLPELARPCPSSPAVPVFPNSNQSLSESFSMSHRIPGPERPSPPPFATGVPAAARGAHPARGGCSGPPRAPGAPTKATRTRDAGGSATRVGCICWPRHNTASDSETGDHSATRLQDCPSRVVLALCCGIAAMGRLACVDSA